MPLTKEPKYNDYLVFFQIRAGIPPYRLRNRCGRWIWISRKQTQSFLNSLYNCRKI